MEDYIFWKNTSILIEDFQYIFSEFIANNSFDFSIEGLSKYTKEKSLRLELYNNFSSLNMYNEFIQLQMLYPNMNYLVYDGINERNPRLRGFKSIVRIFGLDFD